MATKKAAPSNYDYITCKTTTNKEASPVVWQLKPEKTVIGNLTRKTLGKKNPLKKNKTILLVGGTGTGKSTLINALVNFAIGVEFKDDVWFQIVEDERKDQSQSQTSDVIVYEVFGFERKDLPFSLTIIDTPGYGDTGGLEKDEGISLRLLDLFHLDGGVRQIDAVGLVLKSSENRVSDRLSYIFDKVGSMFGKDMEENIVALITYSNGMTPTDALAALDAANIKCARNAKKQPLHFLFDNCQSKARTDDEEVLEDIYNRAMRGMGKFTAFLGKTKSQNMESFVQVHNEQTRLEACIQNLKERVESIPPKLQEIQQTQQVLRKHSQEMKDNAVFNVEFDEHYKDKESVKSGMWGFMWLFYEGAVSCKVCEETCHYPECTTAISPWWCKVMKDGRCTVCTRKCSHEKHVKGGFKYVNKTRRVTKTLQEVREKYEKNKTEAEKKTGILEILQREMETLEATKGHLLNEAYECFVKLEQIALNVVSVSTFEHLEFLIGELRKNKDEDKKVKKLEGMQLKKPEVFLKGLQYSKGSKGK